MPDEMRPAYLIAGSDPAKIDATRARLRSRAESEGGPAALEVFESTPGRVGPDPDAVLASIPAMALTPSRRYLLVDGVDRWSEVQQAAVAKEIAHLPPDITIVLVAHGKAPAKLAKAVEGAGGEVRAYEAPPAREMPRTLVARAAELGFRLEPAAARLLVARMGTNLLRLGGELERLALWAGEGGEVTLADLEAMVSDTSEAAVWSLSDALLERDQPRAMALAERLLDQGENVTGLIYSLASRLRKAQEALVHLERGVPEKQVVASLGMHPYAARQLVARVKRTSLDQLHEASEALADLEVWCRGGADYGEELAFTLALRRASGDA